MPDINAQPASEVEVEAGTMLKAEATFLVIRFPCNGDEGGSKPGGDEVIAKLGGVPYLPVFGFQLFSSPY